MRYIKLDKEQQNVPVFKNVAYAIRLIWQADKRLLIGYLLEYIMEDILAVFIRNVLFLKILLELITGNRDFKTYAFTLLAFAVVSIVCTVANFYGGKTQKKATKNVLKVLNNKVFDKAQSLDIACFEDPSFYDKYQRATLVLTSGYFDIICWDVAKLISSLISVICVFATISVINPLYILFFVPLFFSFAVEISKSKYVYKRDMEMTKNNRTKAYVQRTVFLREYSKDMRTSNIFAVLMKRFDAAIESNIVILKKYGVGLFLYSMARALLEEFIPIVGCYLYAGYEFVAKGTMTVSGFSVVVSSINSVRSVTTWTAECFDDMNQMALYFQNLRDFFDYEPAVISGDKKPQPFESLEFKNVTFRYPSASVNSLNNVNFKLTKGDTLAVV